MYLLLVIHQKTVAACLCSAERSTTEMPGPRCTRPSSLPPAGPVCAERPLDQHLLVIADGAATTDPACLLDPIALRPTALSRLEAKSATIFATRGTHMFTHAPIHGSVDLPGRIGDLPDGLRPWVWLRGKIQPGQDSLNNALRVSRELPELDPTSVGDILSAGAGGGDHLVQFLVGLPSQPRPVTTSDRRNDFGRAPVHHHESTPREQTPQLAPTLDV